MPVTGSLCRFVPVRTASDVYYPLAEGEQVRAEILLPNSVKAPVQAGEEAGRMVFYLGDQPIGETALVYAASAHVDSAGGGTPAKAALGPWDYLPPGGGGIFDRRPGDGQRPHGPGGGQGRHGTG